MNGKIIAIIVAAVLLAGIGYFVFPRRSETESPASNIAADGNNVNENATMKIESSAFSPNGMIPAKYTCDGDNVSPPLAISGTPEDARSLAIIVDDPDAPRGTWVHWLLWNIDPEASAISEDSVPPGMIEGKTSFGKLGYGGSCPPSGTHRYFFKLYALDASLDLPSTSDKAALEQAMEGHILDTAELVGRYSRTQ